MHTVLQCALEVLADGVATEGGSELAAVQVVVVRDPIILVARDVVPRGGARLEDGE